MNIIEHGVYNEVFGCKFKTPMTIKSPIYTWCEKLDQQAAEQAINMSNIEFVHDHVALMGDAHGGYGVPIGSVLPIKDIILPYAVGNDIGCGMRAVKLDFKSHDLTYELIEKIMKEVSRVVPHGTGIGHKQKQSWTGFDNTPEFPTYIQAAHETSEYQLGSLGAGNHFIEILKDDQGYIWLMIHSGSRNLGANVCTEFYHRAVAFCEEYKCKVPSKHLSYLPLDHKDGQWYYDMMNYAMDFAKENCRRMMSVFITIACGMLKCSISNHTYNVHHNFAQLEQHGDPPSWIMVHRKGATPADEGLISIIPGSMGTPSYIVMGKGNPESFNTVSHGAGRAMSRKEAKKRFKEHETRELLKGIWVNHIALDEDPRCYKDIHEVISAQDDLVEPIVKMDPLGVIIGT